jgi:hypothetical protein
VFLGRVKCPAELVALALDAYHLAKGGRSQLFVPLVE